jgi:ABC-type antimicrobial peptide transport system permease subunit
MAETRIKEIGIRKVLGASVYKITALLSKDFLLLVVISLFIAVPVAWLAMQSWLKIIHTGSI